MVNKKILSQLEKLLDLPDLIVKQLGRWLKNHQSFAIAHHPDKEELISKVFKNSVKVLFLVKRSPICKKKMLSMLGCLPGSKWTTFLDKLNSFTDPNILITELLLISLQELILKEKAWCPFWTHVYKEQSEKLLLPTGTDFVGLGSTSSNNWFQSQEVKLPFLTIQTTKLVNKNLLMTYCPSFMSSLAVKWEKEAIPIVKLKTLRIKIYPSTKQKQIVDKFIDTSRFVYNRTLHYIKNGHKANFQDLRDKLVTNKTKKNHNIYKSFDNSIEELRKHKKTLDNEMSEEKEIINQQIKEIQQQRRNMIRNIDYENNSLINNFELNTPKEIRACAVKQCCDAHTSAFTNLRNGNIKFFNMKYKTKKDKKQGFEMTPTCISIENGKIKICPEFFKEHQFLEIDKHNKRKIKHLEVKNNVDLVRSNYGYYLYFCTKTESNTKKQPENIAGVDLGIRTFATVHTNSIKTNETVITEYIHRQYLLRKLNVKKRRMSGRIRKKQFNKIDKKKTNIVDRLHWYFVNHILTNNDVIYLGDIKSHDIVKNGKNKIVNQDFNDLKFYQLKQRLFYKASIQGKTVILVPEHYTTKTCSRCGQIHNKIGNKEIFECPNCMMETGRDMNASKNMKLKGFFI